MLAKRYNINIGAHPSYLDRENFGRTEIIRSPQEVYELVSEQIMLLQKITSDNQATLYHVKPHGALYNMAAKDKVLAHAIALAVKDIDENLILFGLSNSFLISEAKAIDLKTFSEVFADRTYQANGTLTPRRQPDALITDADAAIAQVLRMVQTGQVRAQQGSEVAIRADTVCLHGDGAHALEFARRIHATLSDAGITLRAGQPTPAS